MIIRRGWILKFTEIYRMKRMYSYLVLCFVIIFTIVGCGSSGEEEYRPHESPKTPVIEQPDETVIRNTDIVFYDEYNPATTAILKKNFETYVFVGEYAEHWMTFENNSSDSIHITGAHVVVHDYKSLDSDGYVTFRTGDGDTFDPFFTLYAPIVGIDETYRLPLQYEAHRAELNEYGELIDENNKKDPVFNTDVDAADSVNIRFFVGFDKPGIYTYEIVFDYVYNGYTDEKTAGINTVLYDDDEEASDRAEEEFYENEDYYLDAIEE